MVNKPKARATVTHLPLLPQEALYVGIDIGKFRHVAGFLSKTLLARHERFEGCPTFTFDQSREGFRSLVDRLGEYEPLEHVTILLEHTGHYHRLLEQYLLDLDITVYRVHVQKRTEGMSKTDKRDALGLANTLYTQLALGAQVRDKLQLVRRIVPPTKRDRFYSLFLQLDLCSLQRSLRLSAILPILRRRANPNPTLVGLPGKNRPEFLWIEPISQNEESAR